MKKFLLKIFLCATVALAGIGLFSPIVASAEEGVEIEETTELDNVSSETETSENQAEIVEETETSKWFDETLKPLLLQVGAEVAAFLFVAWLWLKKFGKAKEAFGNAVGILKQSNTDNIDTAKAVEEMRAEYQKRMEEMAEMFKAAFIELKETLGDKVTDIDETAHKLLEVERLAYGSNAKLVNNGTAKRIAEVVGYGKTKNEDEK